MMFVILKQSTTTVGSSTSSLGGDPFYNDKGNKGDEEQNADINNDDC